MADTNLDMGQAGEQAGNYNWFRSESMTLAQLFLQTESSYEIVALLGEAGLCQFRDLNIDINAFQKKFVNEVRRCIEMERKLAFFENEIKRDKIPILDYDEEPSAPSVRDISMLETNLEKLENDLTEANNIRTGLKRQLLEQTELRHILKRSEEFFEEAIQGVQLGQSKQGQRTMRRMSMVDAQLMRRFSVQMTNDGLNIPLDPVVDIYTYTGTILASRFLSFERMLWRISRGNILLKCIEIDEDLEDPETGELQHKCLFILVFQGEKLKATCEKICEGFRTKLYPCPDKSEERKKMHAGVVAQIEDLMLVIKQSVEYRSRIVVATAKNLRQWKVSVAKMRTIYEVMNCFSFDITAKCLIAECWLPTSRVDIARQALVRGQTLSNSNISSVLSVMSTDETPPSLNVTNKFTEGFQNIIDSYGVSDYGEVNPAPFAIISFPFIFAVMFGDAGHGIIMTLFAIWMVWKERSLANVKDEIFSMFFGGRYIILLMGMFSIYTGMIYNDMFAKSINLFGSQYHPPKPDICSNGKAGECFPHDLMLMPNATYTHPDYSYYFGLDPIWQISKNKVLFLNAYKMKMSVILGVIQMFGGVMLSLFNHIHFGHYLSILLEFIPQVIFLLAIFGYMNFMIFFKWFKYRYTSSSCAPSILITLINMFMFKQAEEHDLCYLKDPMYENQYLIQSVLIILAVLCIPWMLLFKPFVDQCDARKKAARRREMAAVSAIEFESFEMRPKVNGGGGNEGSNGQSSDIATTSTVPPGPVSDEKEFEIGDAFINQAIHTIEYCLGSVSHTASYLRLWALSLAHAQLSEVLWNMVMKNAFMFAKNSESTNLVIGAILTFFVFGVWAVLTVAILIMMEGLSAFLHALRLHWVEFMSKFYHGSGYAFAPFAFKRIVAEL